MFDELDLPKKKDATANLTKADLERLSLDELAALKTSRQMDIDMIDAEVARKSAHAAAASALFKTSSA